ncbi:MAG: XRE family transcriptional regulator [Rhodobacteraceae bacterium MED-G07]|nr:MAG: XRE family transcriptional regulator [Rhodobacteraceae bacterium MED-G07]
MHNFDPNASSTLGADLRSLRQSRKMTIKELSEATEKSLGWISQIERDKSQPSIDDLRDLARVLNVPLSILFGKSCSGSEEEGYIVRKSTRRVIGSNSSGLKEELLSPDLTDDFEVLHSTFEPNSKLARTQKRQTQEVGYVISGSLILNINDREFTVSEGDSFRIKGEAHSWANPFSKPCNIIWVIAPPIY